MALAICGRNISLWDTKNCTLLDTFPKESVEDWEYTDISWSCDRKSLAVLRLFGPVEILTVEDGKFTSSQTLSSSIPLDGASYPTSIAFMRHSSRYLAVGSKNGNVTVWDCKAKSFKKTLTTNGPQGEVEFLDFNTIGSHIAAGMSSGNLLVHEYSGDSTNKRYQVPQSTRLTSVRYQPLACASVVGAGSAEGHLAFWNTITGVKVSAILGAHQKAVTDIAFAPSNAKLVATVSKDRRLCFSDFVQRKQVVSCSTTESLTSIDLCDDGVMAVAGTESGRLLAFDIRSLSYPMASYDLQATAVKKLRYATATAVVTIGAAATAATSTPLSQRPNAEDKVSPPPPQTPSTSTDLVDGVFSPLRTESQLYSSLSSCSGFLTQSDDKTPNRSEYKPDISGVKAETSRTPRSANNSLLMSVLKATSFWSNRSETDALVKAPGTYGDVPTMSPIAASDRSVRQAQAVDNAEFHYVLMEDSRAEDGRSELSSANTSTPLHDTTQSLFPFANSANQVEISPIAEISAMNDLSPMSLNGSSSELNRGITVEPTALAEGDTAHSNRESFQSEESGNLFDGEWHSDISSLSGDLEFHSQWEEAVEGATGEARSDLEATQPTNAGAGAGGMAQVLAGIQQLQTLMVENFSQVNRRLEILEERLDKLS